MIRTSAVRFAGGGALCAGLAGGVLALAVRGAPAPAGAWAAAGFFAMAIPIVAAGAWLAHEHGRAGASFVLALATGVLLRAVLLAVVAVAASRRGGDALGAALLGLAAGFVPLTAYEIVWFARRAPAAAREGRGA